jgi:hypothetical protein
MERMMSFSIFQQQPLTTATAATPIYHPSQLLMVDPRLLSPSVQNDVSLQSPNPFFDKKNSQ